MTHQQLTYFIWAVTLFTIGSQISRSLNRFENNCEWHFLLLSSFMNSGFRLFRMGGRHCFKASLALEFSASRLQHLRMCRSRRESSLELAISSTMLERTVETAKKRSPVAQMYSRPVGSLSIFWTMKVATVRESSWPRFMMRRQRGMISVCMRKPMASLSSPLTSAPMTPSEVTRMFSKNFILLEVLRKGQRKSGMCAWMNSLRITGCRARLCSRPSTQHTRQDTMLVSRGGDRSGYICTISWSSTAMVPVEYHSSTARSLKVSLFLPSSSRAFSRFSGFLRAMMFSTTSCSSSSLSTKTVACEGRTGVSGGAGAGRGHGVADLVGHVAVDVGRGGHPADAHHAEGHLRQVHSVVNRVHISSGTFEPPSGWIVQLPSRINHRFLHTRNHGPPSCWATAAPSRLAAARPMCPKSCPARTARLLTCSSRPSSNGTSSESPTQQPAPITSASPKSTSLLWGATSCTSPSQLCATSVSSCITLPHLEHTVRTTVSPSCRESDSRSFRLSSCSPRRSSSWLRWWWVSLARYCFCTVFLCSEGIFLISWPRLIVDNMSDREKDRINEVGLNRSPSESHFKSQVYFKGVHSSDCTQSELKTLRVELERWCGAVEFIQVENYERKKDLRNIAVGFKYDKDALYCLEKEYNFHEICVEPTVSFQEFLPRFVNENKRRKSQSLSRSSESRKKRLDSKKHSLKKEYVSHRSSSSQPHKKKNTTKKYSPKRQSRPFDKEPPRGRSRDHSDRDRSDWDREDNYRTKKWQSREAKDQRQPREQRKNNEKEPLVRTRPKDDSQRRDSAKCYKVYGVPLEMSSEEAVEAMQKHIGKNLKISSKSFVEDEVSVLRLTTDDPQTVDRLQSQDFEIELCPVVVVQSEGGKKWKNDLQEYQVKISFKKEVDCKEFYRRLNSLCGIVQVVAESERMESFYVTLVNRTTVRQLLRPRPRDGEDHFNVSKPNMVLPVPRQQKSKHLAHQLRKWAA